MLPSTRHVREERIALENGAHRPLLRRTLRQVLAVEENATAVRQVETRDHAQESGLAAAGGSEQGEEFARLDGDADLVDRREVAETAGDVLNLEQRHRRRNRAYLMIAGL